MPWAEMNPYLFWAIALPLYILALFAGAAIYERFHK